MRVPSDGGPFARDFEAYYAAGAAWTAGGDPWSRDVWKIERTIPGVDGSRDELLPFVGPAASLPLWSLLARLPFDAARVVWETLVACAFAVLMLCAAALAHVRLSPSRIFTALLFGAVAGPVINGVALGQVALVGAAAIAVSVVALERRSPWAIASATLAAFQPNLALALAVRLTERRTAALLVAAAALFFALTLAAGGGISGLATYVDRLAQHGAGERFIIIQYAVPSVLASFGASHTLATFGADVTALLALVAAGIAAIRFREQPRLSVCIAIALLPWLVPFFHEHDLVIELLPAVILAASADARVRALAAVGAVACFVDWLGVAQHPSVALRTACLAVAVACAAIALPNRSLRTTSPWPALAACAVLVAIAIPLGLAFPAPVWPAALVAFRAAPEMTASAVWAAEQHAAGLDAIVPAWGVLRAIPLLGCALFAVAGYLAAMTMRPERIASGTGISESP